MERYNVDLQKNLLFSSLYASVTLRGILQKKIDEASKNNNFQKKVYQKIFICRGDRSFSRAKKCNIFLKIRVIFNGKPMEIDLPSFTTSIGFLLICLRILREMSDFLLLKVRYLLDK